MLHKKISIFKTLSIQLISGMGVFAGVYLSQLIKQEHKLWLSVFCFISFAYIIFNTIAVELIKDKNGASFKMLIAELMTMMIGFAAISSVE